MGLRGTIKDFSISEIVQCIGQQSKTGILTARSNKRVVKVFFVGGKVARVVPDRNEHRMLMGEMLIALGKLTREQLKIALNEQKKAGQFIGEILLKRKLVNRDDIQEVVQAQIYETIYKIFQWEEGTFEFENRDESESPKIMPSLSSEQLLLNTSWMVDEWKEIKKAIPNLNIIFEKIPQDQHMMRREKHGKGGLNHKQMVVYGLVNGKRTVSDIIQKSMMGQFETCNILVELLRRRYIRKAGIENIPVQRSVEDRSSKFMFHFLSGILVLLILYFGFRYANYLATFIDSHATEISFSREIHVRKVVIPTLYERYLSFILLMHTYPDSLLALSEKGLISVKEAESLSPELTRAYLKAWEKYSPF